MCLSYHLPTLWLNVSSLSSSPLHYVMCLHYHIPHSLMQRVFIIIFPTPSWNAPCTFWDRSDATGGGTTHVPCYTPSAMYHHLAHTWRCVMAIAVCCTCSLHLSICVCMFPDCSGITSIGLGHLSNLINMLTLNLYGVNDSLIYGQAGQRDPLGWIKGMSGSLISLYIFGELPWHGHTVS